MDHGRRSGRVEEPGVPIGLPADPVRRTAVRLVALQDLTHPLRFALVGGVDDDPIADMCLHGGLLAVARLWSVSQPARPGDADQGPVERVTPRRSGPTAKVVVREPAPRNIGPDSTQRG
jgi:hypothetical protein